MNRDVKPLITNKKERVRVLYSLIALGLMLIFIILIMLQNYFQLNILSYKWLRQLRGVTGEVAAYGFALSMGMYVIRRIAKPIKSKDIKQKLLSLAKVLREWHVPISIVAFSIILLHAYIMVSKGIFLNLRYISGLFALGVLGVQIVSGIFRYKRIGIKFHMITGIIFTLSMIIHLLA